jgi:hypothetical protein
MTKKTIKILIWVGLLSIAMGYLETAVVVYIRELIYPDGFKFPLQPIEAHLVFTEVFRELATMIMLISIGVLAGRKPTERFAYFILSFAIWDIFYYVFLKVLIDWPESLLTWDVLFLIPVTWTGPVITPVIVALLMIVLALFIIYFTDKQGKTRILGKEWVLLIGGSLIVIIAFCWDYSRFILKEYSFLEVFTVPQDALFDLSLEYIPVSFNWWLYFLGIIVIISGIFSYAKRSISMYD